MIKFLALTLFLSFSNPVKNNWEKFHSFLNEKNRVQLIEPQYSKQIKCRITYYCASGKWGSRTADPKTKKAIRGITVAAHPDFKFGQKIYIPKLKGVIGDGKFIVQDRGPAVTSKKASRRTAYVFDIFVSSQTEISKMSRQNAQYMTVYIK